MTEFLADAKKKKDKKENERKVQKSVVATMSALLGKSTASSSNSGESPGWKFTKSLRRSLKRKSSDTSNASSGMHEEEANLQSLFASASSASKPAESNTSDATTSLASTLAAFQTGLQSTLAAFGSRNTLSSPPAKRTRNEAHAHADTDADAVSDQETVLPVQERIARKPLAACTTCKKSLTEAEAQLLFCAALGLKAVKRPTADAFFATTGALINDGELRELLAKLELLPEQDTLPCRMKLLHKNIKRGDVKPQ